MKRQYNGILMLVLVLLLLGGICFVSFTRGYVGQFRDDAIYILASESIRQGKYVIETHPGYNFKPTYPPGMSILLLPVTFISTQSGYYFYRWLLLIYTFITIFLLYLWLNKYLPKLGLNYFKLNVIPILLLIGIHPLFVNYASQVMAEIPYLLFSVLFLLYLEKTELSQSIHPRPTGINFEIIKANVFWVWLGCLNIIIISIRPIGVTLFLALVIFLIIHRRFDRLFPVLLFPMLVLSLWLLNHIQSGTLKFAELKLNDWLILPRGNNALDFIYHLIHNVMFYSKELFTGIIFPGLTFGWLPYLGYAGWWLVFYGIYRCMQKSVSITELYFIFYGLFILFWRNYSGRYLLPVLPLLIIYLYIGITALIATKFRRLTVILFTGVMFLCIIYSHGRTFIFKPESRRVLPKQTFTWIKTNVPADEIVMADPTFYLYTRHPSIFYPSLAYRYSDDFFYFICLNKIRYLITYDPETFPSVRGTFNNLSLHWLNLNRFCRTEHKRYRLVYASPEEKVEVYQVNRIEGDKFLTAYNLFLTARQQLETNELNLAETNLRAAIKEYPEFVKAKNSLAYLFFIEGKDSATLKLVDENLGTDKTYPYTYLTAGLVFLKINDADRARRMLNFAGKKAYQYGDERLVKTVISELNKIKSKLP